MKYLLPYISLVFALSSQAQIYQCEKNGETTFSDTPCDVSTSAYGSTQTNDAEGSARDPLKKGEARLMDPEESDKSFMEERALINKRREVADLREEVADLKEEMNKKLADLTRKQAQITHNLEHSTTDPETSKEIGDTRDDYRSRIRDKREELLEAEKELREMRE